MKSIEQVVAKIKNDLSASNEKGSIILIYAFNGTGKTRISSIMDDSSKDEDLYTDEIKVLSYNAFFEDMFVWDNEECYINFDPKNRFIKFIFDEGLENQITDNFQKLTNKKLSPNFDFENGIVNFNFSTGDDSSNVNIKISRGEESMFVWSIYFTVLTQAILTLNIIDKDNRSSKIFDSLEYIVIDDPVSSIDDNKIVTMTVEICNLLKEWKNNFKQSKILITTHHPLFFNILHNEIKSYKNYKSKSYILNRNTYSDNTYSLSETGDAPFAYHLSIIEEIKKAIIDKNIKKFHYNLFRGLLEKTANFLGYKKWDECLEEQFKPEIVRLINQYSHSKLSDLESKDLSQDNIQLFTEAFENFIKKNNWNTK